MPTVLVINGPNLNLLGVREPEVYGTTTLDEVKAQMTRLAAELRLHLEFFESNHEGEIIDRMQQARGEVDYMIINPGGLTHTSYSIHDAISATEIPTIEVHISNIFAREMFRQESVIAPACHGMISGFGTASYLIALHAVALLAAANDK